MNKKLLQSLSKVISERKALEEEEKVLKQALLEEMRQEGKEKEVTDYGTFSLSRRANYIFSEALRAKIAKLEVAKEKEKQNGSATVEYSEYLQFREAK